VDDLTIDRQLADLEREIADPDADLRRLEVRHLAEQIVSHDRQEIVRHVSRLLERDNTLSEELFNSETFWKQPAQRLIKYKNAVRRSSL
jgi:hypothetical protein